MNPVVHSENNQVIVYDAKRVPKPNAALFDPDYWQKKGLICGQAAGRGNTLFLNTEFGPAVLRRYKRGGWPAKLSEDRYLYTGITRSRPYWEFHILRQLKDLGLPVPAPLAALIDNAFISYRGALLMELIKDVKPLTSLLGAIPGAADIWANTGACIRRFHDAGLNHVDLNAGNILVNPQDNNVYLVDFDRCTLSIGEPVAGASNLARLKRSMLKLWPADNEENLEDCWKTLLSAYHD